MSDYPNDQEAERCAIGCMVNGAGPGKLLSKHFYSEHHAAVFEVLVKMQSGTQPMDAVTVVHAAAKEGVTIRPLEMVRFLECCTHTAYMDAYSEILIECWRRRRMVEAAEWLLKRASDLSKDVDETWLKLGSEVVSQKKWSK